jgi:hypothetical protein
MDNTNPRQYTGKILFKPLATTEPQIVLDCAQIYAQHTAWIASYAQLPSTQNPPPIFYSNPGWEFFLESLQVNYFAASLKPAPAPEIKANSSQADKLIAVQAISREFKKFEISILERLDAFSQWHIVGIENMHNYGNIFNFINLKTPFLSQGDVDFGSPTSQIAIQFRGKDEARRIEMITDSDIISIRGCWRAAVSL